MKFQRIGRVIQLTGLSRMTIYRLELAGEFPKRRKLSENSVAWLEINIGELGAEPIEVVVRPGVEESAECEGAIGDAAEELPSLDSPRLARTSLLLNVPAGAEYSLSWPLQC